MGAGSGPTRGTHSPSGAWWAAYMAGKSHRKERDHLDVLKRTVRRSEGCWWIHLPQIQAGGDSVLWTQQCTFHKRWKFLDQFSSYDKFYWIKPSLHNTIDSCILQLVASATCFGLAWPSSGLQRLVSIKVHNVAEPMGSHGLQCKPWDPIMYLKYQLRYIMLLYWWDPMVYIVNHGIPLCTLIDTNLCKLDDGQARPKHVADVTSCRIQLSIVLCKDGLIQ